MLANDPECSLVLCRTSSSFSPYPVSPSWSFTALYLFFKFFVFVKHCVQSLLNPNSCSFFDISISITLFLTAPSSSSCTSLSHHTAINAFISLSPHTAPRLSDCAIAWWCVLETAIAMYSDPLVNRISCLHAHHARFNPHSTHIMR